MSERLIFEQSHAGVVGFLLPDLDIPSRDVVPGTLRRTSPPILPEVSEPEVVRHFTNLSISNHHVDKAIYPLGSCTMKYNPKINDRMASLPGFARLHPMVPDASAQGTLQAMCELEQALSAITGLSAVSLAPAAGAQGEMTCMLMVRAFHTARGEDRDEVIIPDSAHGTNPASVRIAGMKAVEIKSNAEGRVDLDALRPAIGPRTAAMMLTNPNTLGMFESEIESIAALLHENGALLYLDGANMNALSGLIKPADMGFDMMHFNLHKTFSTPHGGGGPGAGPIAVLPKLEPFLPKPRIIRDGESFRLENNYPHSVGRVHSYVGNTGVLLRALTYIMSLGADGIRQMSRKAIINANYLLARLQGEFAVKVPGPCMHEFVLSASRQKKHGVRGSDISKRLLDFGLHAPTTYFPLIVEEALMIEPTESESRDSLDRFAEAMLSISSEAKSDPEKVKGAPYTTSIQRPDEARAARRLKLRWEPHDGA